MLKMLAYRLKTVPNEARQFQETLERFNKACTYIAAYADKNQVYGLAKLRKHPTQRVLLNKSVQNRFGIQSGVTEAAIRRVVNDYARLNPHVRAAARREVLPTYEGNGWILCTAATASVVMKTLHPGHMSKYPMRVSLSTYKKKGGRLRLPFKPPVPQTLQLSDGDTMPKNEMRLGVNPTGDVWSLVVAVDVPEEVVLDDGVDPREHPDYQEPDYTPSEDPMFGYVSPDEDMG